jgi:hypothetical protein
VGKSATRGRSVIAVAQTAEHSAESIFTEAARELALINKQAYIERRLVETATERAAAMDAFNRGLNSKGAGPIIKMIGDEADAIFGILNR